MSKVKLIAEPGKHESMMTRIFDAPRELVFKTDTDPTSISQWWGPSGGTTRVDKLEVKPDGLWRYFQSDADGNAYAFSEKDGKTTLTDSSVFQSVAARDGMLNTGMEAGANESMNRLAELLKKREEYR